MLKDDILIRVDENKKNNSNINRCESLDSFLIPKSEQNKLSSITYGEAFKKRTHVCLYPSCNSKSINSHSIPKSFLESIADEKGFLTQLTIKAEFRFDGGINCEAKLTSYNSASTFPGFCSKHDNSLFNPIDSEDISIKNTDQMFLLLYRSVSREFVKSELSYKSLKRVFERVSSELSEINDYAISMFISSLYIQYCNFHWLSNTQAVLNELLTENKTALMGSLFEYGCIELEYIPLLVNVCCNIVATINGIVYTSMDFTKEELPFFSMTSIPDKRNNKLRFYYFFRKDQLLLVSPVIQQLKTKDIQKLQLYLSDIIIRYSENFYMSTLFWDSIPSMTQDKIKDVFYNSTLDRTYKLDNDINFWCIS